MNVGPDAQIKDSCFTNSLSPFLTIRPWWETYVRPMLTGTAPPVLNFRQQVIQVTVCGRQEFKPRWSFQQLPKDHLKEYSRNSNKTVAPATLSWSRVSPSSRVPQFTDPHVMVLIYLFPMVLWQRNTWGDLLKIILFHKSFSPTICHWDATTDHLWAYIRRL